MDKHSLYELCLQRISSFRHKELLTTEAGEKLHSLLPTSLLVVLKIFSASSGLSFPRVTPHLVKDLGKEIPDVYLTEKGLDFFDKQVSNMSPELFTLLLPILKNMHTPASFLISDHRIRKNILGQISNSQRTKPKPPIKIVLFIDNNPPYDYLEKEYIYDNVYEARMFINNLIRFMPPSRLELWRVRTTGARVIKEQLDLITTKKPYNMNQT